MAGPLEGVRVLDLTTVVMGPYATQILGDFGADVVKLEPPEGDVMRRNAPMRSKGMGHIFMNANRNKRSVVLDLKSDAGRAACLALARKADVLIYNIRPQAMARLKLSYEDVRAVNPRIIYVGGFGYSQRGPYAAKPAYDDLIQGAIGLPWLFREAGGSSPRYLPSIVADRATALHVVNAVCAALYRREKSGVGQRIDVPMFESLLQFVLGEHLAGETFVPPEGRSLDYESAYELVADEMKKRGTAEWIAALEAADIPVQRMNSLADLLADPHLAAIGYFREVEHPTEGRIRALAVPSEWSESVPEYRRHAPQHGEHTREVLREAGLAEAEIERMMAEGSAKGG
jgi:crotonobetainyl-CoA:carnitine CoA-transferase CaiB-like acyl-CoA transferase